MAAPSALSPTQLQAIGSFLQVVGGVAGGTSTSTVVTVPQFSSVKFAVACAAGSTATAPRCDSYSGNTFTVTHASGELFTYFAFGNANL